MRGNTAKKTTIIALVMAFVVFFAVFKENIIESFESIDEQTGSSTLTDRNQNMYVITLRYMFENGTLAQSRDVYSFVDTGEVDQNGDPVQIDFTFDYDATNTSADGYIPVIDGYTPNKTVITDTIDSTYITRMKSSNDVIVVEPAENDFQIYKIYYTITYSPASSWYNVEHYLENVSKTGYTLYQQYQLTDNVHIGDAVVAQVQDIEGFTFNSSLSTISANVEKNGGTTLSVYYDRNVYNIYFDSTGGTYYNPTQQNYGDTIDYSSYVPERAGYTFGGWQCYDRDTGSTITTPSTMPSHDIYLRALWTPTTSSFTITYFVENADDENYSNVGTYVVNNIATESVISNLSNINTYLKNGFESLKGSGESSYYTYNSSLTSSNLNVSVAGDGSTNVAVYYDRNEYTLTFVMGYKSSSRYYFYYSSIGTTPTARYTTTEIKMNAPDGNTYTMQSQNASTGHYTITAKYEANIADLWPTASKNIISPTSIAYSSSTTYYPYGWTYVKNGASSLTNQTSGVTNLTNNFIGTDGKGKTLYLRWNSTASQYVAHYMFETIDGSGTEYNGTHYVEETAYQSSFANSNVSHKPIVHYYFDSSEIVTNGYDIYLYYHRNRYELIFRNYTENVEPDVSDITIPDGVYVSDGVIYAMYGSNLSAFKDVVLTSDQYPLQTFGTKEWTFEGWYQDEARTIPMDWNVDMQDNLVVYAKWIPPTYGVELDTNGGIMTTPSGYTNTSTYTYEYTADEGETLSYPGSPTKNGYTFAGWYYINELGREVEYLFSTSQKVYSDLNIYAKWTPDITGYYNVYYVEAQYNQQGNVITDVSQYTNPTYLSEADVEGPVEYGKTVTAKAKFIAPQNGRLYIVDSVEKQTTVNYGEDNNIFFIYTPVENLSYTVYYLKQTYDENGNPIYYEDGEVPPLSEQIATKDVVTVDYLESNTVTHDAKLIDGYETDAYAKTLILTSKTREITPEQNAMYFYYVPVENTGEYRVNYYFMDNNGNYPQSPTRVVNGETSVGTFISVDDYATYLPINENQSLYEGHEIDHDSSNILMVVVSSYGVSEIDVYLKNSTYTVTYNINGGIWTDTSNIYSVKTAQEYETEVTYGDNAPVPTNPTRNNYRFKGWYSNDACTNEYNFNDSVSNDITLYAGWVEQTSVTINKIWVDNNDQDGIRPASSSVTLRADGVDVQTVTLNESNNWTITINNLDVTNNSGSNIIYSIIENAITSGYTPSYSVNDNNLTVTNTHVPETKNLTIQKEWADNNNQDGIRPSSVNVTLKQGNNVYKNNILLSSSNSWEQVIEVPVYSNGIELIYSIEEDLVTGYTTTYDTVGNTYIVTNTHIPATKTLTIEKNWDDDNNRDGIRPNLVNVDVKNGNVTYTTATLTSENGWKTTIPGVPVYNNGSEIIYTVEENDTTGYTSQVLEDGVNNKFIITNTHSPEKITLNLSKVWDDGNDQDGIRPSSINVDINQDGNHLSTVTLSSNNSWTEQVSELYKYSNGTEITYTVEEEHTNGYTTSVQKDGNNVIITNTHIPAVTQVSVDKIWNDGNNQDGKRTENVTVNLYANNVYIESQELSDSNSWTYTFENLPENSAGIPITYTIDESAVADYTTAIEYDEVNGIWHVTNTHIPETRTFVVNKVWDDDSDRDGKRPSTVTINLNIDGTVSQTKYITAGNNWSSISFDDLPAYSNGSQINYTITENEVDNYATNIVNEGDNFTVINTHYPELISKTVTKQWRDGSNQEGFRPESTSFKFYKNGVQYGEEITLTSANEKAENPNEWTYTYYDLYRYENGEEVKYTVEEQGLINGQLVIDASLHQIYSAIYNQDTLYIYNAYPPEIMVGAHKNWEDENNADGYRPSSIPIQLKYKTENDTIYQDYIVDGQNIGYQVLNDSNNWTYDFGFLQKYNDLGELLEYSVEEAEIPANYTLTSVQENEEETTFMKMFEITNTLDHAVEKTSRKVSINWLDANDQDGLRPTSVIVRLKANGTEIGNMMLSSENGWSDTFTNLNVNSNGNPISYAIEVDSVSDYSTTITYNSTDLEFNVENTHMPATKTITLNKIWVDNNNQDGLRTNSVDIEVYANDILYQEVELNLENSWTDTLTDVPVNNNGVAINYTVNEITPTGYTSTITQNGDVFNIINTHVPEKRNIKVSKIWNDDNNRDGVRPTNVEFSITADGTTIYENLILNSSNNWEYTVNNLDKYSNGVEIEYRVSEISVSNYTTSYNYDDLVNNNIVITNTHTPSTKNINIKKVWEDEEDTYGVRPSSITVSVLANNVEVAQTVLYASSNWETTVGGLYVNDGGQAITYTVSESSVNKYSSSHTISNDTITLTNTVITYNINTNVDGSGGTISGQNITPYEKVAKGESNKKLINITPNTGYVIKSIKINDVEQDLPADVSQEYTLPTITNILENKNIVVEFERAKYSITTSVDGGHGTISGDGDVPYEKVSYQSSTTKDIVITPDYGYEIESITINNVEQDLPQDPTQPYTLPTITNICEDTKVVVKFTKTVAAVKVIHQTVDGDILTTEIIDGYIGDSYETSPIDEEYYTLEETPENAEGIMEQTQTEVVYIYEYVPPLTITKTVKGSYSDVNKVFQFDITLIDRIGLPLERNVTYTIYNEDSSVDSNGSVYDGTLSFNLKNGQKIVFNNISNGTTYTITEENDTSYTTYIDNTLSSTKSIRAVLTSSTTVDFVNEKNYNAPTGLTFSILPYTLGFAIVVALFLVVKKVNKNRKVR